MTKDQNKQLKRCSAADNPNLWLAFGVAIVVGLTWTSTGKSQEG